MSKVYVIDIRGSWDYHLSLVEFAYNNNYNMNIQIAPYKDLYERKCKSLINLLKWYRWKKIMGPEFVQQAIKKIQLIRDFLRIAHSRQKSYADNRRWELEFQIEDHILLRVFSIKGVMRFGVREKLSPYYMGLFKILERIGTIGYRLALLLSLVRVHDIFHVSILRKYILDVSHMVGLAPLQFTKDLSYDEQLVRIVDRKE